ncbi:MAG: cysteine desulfurase family protein, partial [Coriobacteriia bacterium]|nr:cysteine desulfurase family protein [Coriobacteriia bacterium]
MAERNVYLDYSATTPVDKRVVEAMLPYFSEEYGNPNSLYELGRNSFKTLDAARDSIVEIIGAAHPNELLFTGCGTEADNTAVLGIADAVRTRSGRDHVIVSAFEHKAVLSPAEYLGKHGYEVSLVQPRTDGIVHPADLAKLVTDRTSIVSVMHVNNEIGTIQPIKELADAAHEKGALFHTDAIQSVGKIDFDVTELGIDSASFSAHKIYGPKGIGALYVKKGTPITPMLIGGGQEFKRRSGTQNVAGAVALSTALRIMAEERATETPRLAALRDRLVDELLGGIENTVLNGDRSRLVPHIANFIIKGIEGEAMLLQLDNKGISVSTGSACSSGSLEPSHVLLAIGCPPELAHGSLRVSLGRFTTEDDVDYFMAEFPPIVERLRAMSPVYAKM